MLDLGAYDSSSEEEDTQTPLQSKQSTNEPPIASAQIDQADKAQLSELNAQEQKQQPLPESKPPSGPILALRWPLFTIFNIPSSDPRPHSSSRAQYGYPTFSPGSPNPAANAKFEHFLSLKKQGVHFNSKLASSSSLKNPSLLKKMMEHAGINEQSQYNTALSTELWDASSLPQWGFKEELLRAQQDARQKLDEKNASGQRSAVEFVSGSGAK
ncbi:hypothetical protein N7509_002168 [Penicillium cosmopolitanum]|uniref:HCNGP-like protein n=1 Tax=Penicillium cosmopolitanum TaxID=1131564 RepID=A0A9X0BD73_9EURO|nr:uncharacterized protein N7509_002168 [Penicillium cosmopolitanum]KAJ5408285.1 hypothetical protein N7509_002168 [Penicillium cosmopolitanum]